MAEDGYGGEECGGGVLGELRVVLDHAHEALETLEARERGLCDCRIVTLM